MTPPSFPNDLITLKKSASPLLNHPDKVLLGGCGFELALGALALLLGWIIGPDPRASIPTLTQTGHLGRDLLYGTIAAVPWLLAVSILDRVPWRWTQKLRESAIPIAKMLKSVSVPGLAVLAASAGVGEELLFRGWLQNLLAGGSDQASTGRLVLAISGASLAFGLVHSISRIYVMFAFAMGTYLGCLFAFGGSLLIPIVTHSVYDFGALLLLVRQCGYEADEEEN